MLANDLNSDNHELNHNVQSRFAQVGRGIGATGRGWTRAHGIGLELETQLDIDPPIVRRSLLGRKTSGYSGGLQKKR
jgi:hypothetical protein